MDPWSSPLQRVERRACLTAVSAGSRAARISLYSGRLNASLDERGDEVLAGVLAGRAAEHAVTSVEAGHGYAQPGLPARQKRHLAGIAAAHGDEYTVGIELDILAPRFTYLVGPQAAPCAERQQNGRVAFRTGVSQ